MEKVLIIDEDLKTCEILENFLLNWGYSVSKSYNGKDGLAKAQKLKPDIIILEIILPGMNGFEICKKIKAKPDLQDTPIIILTLLKDSEDELYAYEAGADFFLTKPVNYKLLKNRIEALIKYKKTMENMEEQEAVVEVLLRIMENYDKKLFEHSCCVRDYCIKVTHIIYLDFLTVNKLLIGASLHDYNKLKNLNAKVNKEIGILKDLKMAKWLNFFINSQDEELMGKIIDKQLALALQILNTVNRFVEFWEITGDKEKGLEKLKQEIRQGLWTKEVGEALVQVVNDEIFLINFNSENS